MVTPYSVNEMYIENDNINNKFYSIYNSFKTLLMSFLLLLWGFKLKYL